MVRRKIVLLAAFMVMCTMLAAVAVYIMAIDNENLLLSVQIETDNQREKIKVWLDEEKNAYVFLPGYIKLETASIIAETDVWIDGRYVRDGILCDEFELDVPYELTYNAWGKERKHKLTFLQSADVATVYIDTRSGDMDYINAKKGNEESGTIRIYTAESGLDYSGNIEKINGRGNSTWDAYDKKPYTIKISKEADLLGMGAAQRWVLLANAVDASNMRNKTVYDFADEIGLDYAPDAQWVDLYINSEYRGLYLLTERIEIHPERVNISAAEGIVVSRDVESELKKKQSAYIKTQYGNAYRIHEPDIVNSDVEAFVEEKLNSVEALILSDASATGGKSLSDMIDMDSWARKFLIDDIFSNPDSGLKSDYFYFDFEGDEIKVFSGPVWDYDVAIGNKVVWQFKESQVFVANRRNAFAEDDDLLNYTLYMTDEFYNYLLQVYQNVFLPKLEETLMSKIDDYACHISHASVMNQIRWKVEVDLWTEVINMKKFINERMSLLSNIWFNNEEYLHVQVDPRTGAHYAHYAVSPGETLNILYNMQSNEFQTFLGWYYVDTDEPFDPQTPIYEDTQIYAKWVDNHSTKIEKMLKLAPLAMIAVLGVGLLGIEICRMRKRR